MLSLSTSNAQVPCVISPEEAREHFEAGDVVFADVRWYPDGRSALTSFQQRHVTGARFVDVERDLTAAGNIDPHAGRHPLPNPDEFASAMSRLGIDNNTWVIAYDDTGGMTAARLVVMLRLIGHKASLLDGGLDVWSESNPDLVDSGEPKKAKKTSFASIPWPEHRLVSIDDMRSIVSRRPDAHGVMILDARSRERFEGSAPCGPDTLDPRAGHLPGAVNSPWSTIVSSTDHRLLPADDLRAHFTTLGIDNADEVISSCGSGISACLNLLAIEHAGLGSARLFVPSWSGWSSDSSNPVEVGHSSMRPGRLRRSRARRRMQVVRDLRTARRKHRLADLEWFEALYRVYLAAFVFGGGVMFIAGFVPDETVSQRTAGDVWRYGPGWLGLAAVLAIGVGLRSGTRGGPLAIEEADVRHVLLAPVSRRRVLLRPAVQAARTAVFSTVVVGALGGYLAARRLPGTAPHWVGWGCVWGATAGLLYAGGALVAHSIRLPRWLGTAIAVALVAWQVLCALPARTGIAIDAKGIGDLHGELALGVHGISAATVVFPLVALGLVCLGLALVGRQSVDALVRRSSLVSQLRFAVTIQDLRTVTLLRRRLSQEQSRTTPWIDLRKFAIDRRGALPPEWRRAWSGLLRFPLSRIIRIVLLCIVAGLALTAAYHGTSPAIVVAGGALFMVALEILEPLAQEIDQSDRTSAYPHPRGLIHVRLTSHLALVVPILVAIIVSTVLVVEPDMWLIAAIGSLGAVLAACAGAAVNIVSGSPDPTNTAVSQNIMPPEVAGTVSIVKSLWPLALCVAGCVPFVAAAVARTNGNGPEAATLRSSIAVVIGAGIAAAWIRKRDDIRRSLDQAASGGRGSFQKGRS